MSQLFTADPGSIQFVDHRGIDWRRVKRTRYFCYQRFRYEYPGPVRNLYQHLIVVPIDRYGDQRLCDYRLSVSPHPATHQLHADRFGNRVFKLEVGWIERNIAFEVRTEIERTVDVHPVECIACDQLDYFLQSTHLTTGNPRITAVAQDLVAQTRTPYDLAERISDWVSNAMTYGSGATGVRTTAAEALETGRGLCQDYAHIMLALCRAVRLPARYVSGHMLGEGGSHAWVEVLLKAPNDGPLQAVGFDPTNRRQPNLGYTTVAIGRDYADVAPTSGTYTAPYGGALSFTKRAGLTLLEYTDGEVVSSA